MKFLLLPLLAGVCLALTDNDVLAAIRQAKTNLQRQQSGMRTIKEDGRTLQTQKANDNSQQEQVRGDLLAEVTRILIEKEGMGIRSQLEKVDINTLIARSGGYRAKRQANSCGAPLDSTNCQDESNRIRSITGVCNNRRNRDFGKAVSPIRRLLGNASYEDGMGTVRTRGVNGQPLPSARDISNRLFSEGANIGLDLMTNHLHQQYGQWIAHDVIFMPSAVGPNGETVDCSDCNSAAMSGNCAPIRVPNGDTYFPPNSCIRLTRALNGQRGLGQRTQIGQNTHFLDLSPVYGSDECTAAQVRSFRNGELKVFNFNNRYDLPPQDPTDPNCQSRGPNFCFLCGDFRNSLHPGLIPLHTIYILEHNRMAQAMRRVRPDWNDERLYQEARRLMIARYQRHVYNEYLPKLLGRAIMDEFRLTVLPGSQFTQYNESVDPSLTAEFAASAFRFGHSQIRRDLPRMNNNNQTLAPSLDLGNNIFYAESLYQASSGGWQSLLDGMIQAPGMLADRQFSHPVRNQMFELRGQRASGVDLAAVNVMRGRDVGIFPYNDYRVRAGLPRARSFDDLLGQMDAANVNALRSTYASVDDIDLYAGIMLERPANGALVGRTGAFIMAEQFAALKFGDRFYFEHQAPNTRSFSPEELAAIKTIGLSKTICVVSPQIEIIHSNIFDLNSPRTPCGRLSDINITPFTRN